MSHQSNTARYTIFLHSFYGGGAEKVLVGIANRLAARGESIDIVAGNAEGPVLQMVSQQVNIVDLGCDRTYKAIWPLACYLKRHKPRALVTSIIHSNLVASLAHRLSGQKTNLILREANPEHTGTLVIPRYKALLYKLLARWAYRYADNLVCVSHALEDILRSDLGLRAQHAVDVIYNPIAVELESMSLELPERPLTGDSSLPVILGVGRLVELKGFHVLIDAFAQVRESVPCRLVILGQGEYQNQLMVQVRESGLEDWVEFPGYISNPLPYMKLSAVYVLCSFLEGMPNALVEAIACGTPVVATDCPTGPAELLDNGRIGALVPVGDAERMAQAILGVLGGDVPDFDRDEWRAHFDPERIVDQYFAIMNR